MITDLVCGGPGQVVFWDDTRHIFWATSRALYPRVLRLSDSSWLWYLRHSESPRLFFNTRKGRWERWPKRGR